MAYEGLRQTIIALRNNKNLSRRKSMFKKENGLFKIDKKDLKSKKRELKFKTISKKEFSTLKNKLKKQRKYKDKRTAIIFILICITFIILGFHYSTSQKKNKESDNELIKEKYFIENINKYTHYIEEGDLWIEKKHWNNAIFKYKQASEIFPKQFEAKYRLILAYSYKCKFRNKDCEKGKNLNNILSKKLPENLELKKLEEIFAR